MNSSKKSFLLKALMIVGVLLVFIGVSRFVPLFGAARLPLSGGGSILALKLKGVLVEKDKFLEQLRLYSKR